MTELERASETLDRADDERASMHVCVIGGGTAGESIAAVAHVEERP